MKRLVLLGLALAACSQRQSALPVGIPGAFDLAQAGDLLFVNSTDRNELRVLNLAQSPREFVRAPNPLQALSIPVLDRPTGLVREVRYGDGLAEVEEGVQAVPPAAFQEQLEGKKLVRLPGASELGGPHLYVMSAGSPEISIVGPGARPEPGADPLSPERSELKELARLPTSAPVTAMAARGSETQAGTLYYATYEPQAATVWSAEVPPPGELTLDAVLQSVRFLARFPGESVTALLALPGQRLVIATRRDQGRSGQTLLFDARALAATPLPFSGPVRQLATHPAVYEIQGDQLVRTLPEGQRVYGLLDEQACAGSACGGLLAVDVIVNPPTVVTDGTGQPMAPIRFGAAVALGLSLGTAMNVQLPAEGGGFTGAVLPLLGLVTASTGELFLFDARFPRHIDTDPAPAEVSGFAYGETSLDPEENDLHGPRRISVADGAAPDESVSVIYQGRLPGLVDLPTQDADGVRFPAPEAFLPRAAAGDILLVSTSGGSCEVQVASVETQALVTSALPPGCGGRVSFTVRASAARPYVVVGSESGFMGRVGAGEAFSFSGAYFHHPDGFDPKVPLLRFAFGKEDPAIQRDSGYRIQIDGHFAPLAAVVDPGLTGIGSSLYFPGSPVLDSGRQLAFIAYPSANAIVELEPGQVQPPVVRKVVPYR